MAMSRWPQDLLSTHHRHRRRLTRLFSDHQRENVIAWRDELERRSLAGSSVWRVAVGQTADSRLRP